MGVILSRFRRKRTALEELERIEEKIQDIEKYRQVTEQQQKRVVGKLVIYSVGVYVLAATLFYFCFFPASLRDRIFYIIPLIIFPVIVVLVKKLISWFYVRRMTKQQDQLHQLKSDKQKLLDNVMEKETYRVARMILEKFAPEHLRSNKSGPPVPMVKGASKGVATDADANKAVAIIRSGPVVEGSNELRHRTPAGGQKANDLPQLTAQMPALNHPQSFPLSPVAPRPRPVLPREPGMLDRLVESLVGDGPSRRYALICSNCHGHNGMALREEFLFLSYRCCYCSFYNHAKKQRPVPPKILDKEELERKAESSAESDSETQSSDFEEIRPETDVCENDPVSETSPDEAESERPPVISDVSEINAAADGNKIEVLPASAN